MKRVLFLDPMSQRPYQMGCPDRTPPGGTEATLLRVAKGLTERGYEIWISQNGRKRNEKDAHGINYFPFRFRDSLRCPSPDVVVNLRAYKIMPWLRRTYRNQSMYLWLHCFPGTRRRCLGKMAAQHNFTVIAVSRSHSSYIKKRCGTGPVVLYNPLEPGLERLRTQTKQSDTMIFFSSPHKGLTEVLGNFRKMRLRFPNLKLKVANPGYILEELQQQDGVVDLGALPHDRVLREVASSFCVFYPQTTFAETFGLVFAEANAVGTPVLTHDLGAAAEVLSSADQIVDCSSCDRIADRLTDWREGERPRPRMDQRFRLDNVLDIWEDLLLSRTAASLSKKRLISA